MKRLFTTIIVATVFALTGCSSTLENNDKQSSVSAEKEVQEIQEISKPTTVEITDIHGTIIVPINPKTVVSLDSRTYETLSDWGVELAAAPKAVMPDGLSYITDEAVLDIGNHREPNLEIIAGVNPDLVIVGQRFANYYEDIKAIVPNAVVIDINIDVSESAESSGDNFIKGFINNTTTLGLIFDKEEEANKLIAEFEKSITAVNEAYNGTDTVMSVIVSGGNIGYSAPSYGRVWGPLYEIFDFVPALDVNNSSTDHQGDEISIEAIAQSNPDWIFVLDRDAGVSSTESQPATDIIDNSPALANTTAIIGGNVLYAPNDTYSNESIQTYIELFINIAEAFSK